MSNGAMLHYAVAFSLAALLVGCGGTPTEPTATPTVVPPTATTTPFPPTSAPSFPTGFFVHESQRSWAFQFNEDGTWAYFFGNLEVPEVEGTYSVDGNLYTETSASDPACPFPASYTWGYDGERLTFALSGEDECRPRRNAYDGQTYLKLVFPTGMFAANDGDWVFILEADGSWTWSEDGQVEATGTYSIQDNEVTWETDSYCGPATEKSTYTWSYEGGTLLFQVKGRDSCLARREVVNNVPYEAVSPRPSEGITVTFEGDQCVYHGPEGVRAGEIPLILDVRDQSAREKYWVVAYTLDEGKTKEDLRAWKEVGHSPLWVGFHGMLDEQPAGTMQETTIILFEGPLYLACITEPPGYITDVLGPIDVAPAASAP